MYISTQKNPNIQELTHLFETAFQCLIGNESEKFSDEQDQSLLEWFDVNEMIHNLKEGGILLEARDDDNSLVGALFLSKQNPISWPDGKKAEIYIIATKPEARGKGIGKKLVLEAEDAARNMGAKAIIVNTHILMELVASFYEKNGYTKIGILKQYYENGDAVFFLKQLEKGSL
jgi:ribosomal protein S18 acetylase RimI-like enzyme